MSVNFMAKRWKFPYCRNAMHGNPAARPVLNASPHTHALYAPDLKHQQAAAERLEFHVSIIT